MNNKLKLLIFPFFYLKEVVVSSVQVARDIVLPTQNVDPAIILLDVSESSPRQRYITACLISMTPGTLSVSEDSEKGEMVIHCLYGKEATSIKEHLQQKYVNTIQHLPFL